MSAVAIRVENLSKRYRRGLPAGHDRLTEVATNLGRRLLALPRRWLRRCTGAAVEPAPAHAGDFWALKDVSFEVRQGEVVGIVGRNGAGKSTLLKILSRITEPTEGRFGLCGRIGSLLEVGTGFHPELTGRENVYLNGNLLGMSRAEVRKKFDAIAAFAEIDAFLDTPVKRYSSGMQVRLGFAVAAHLETDTLIVDEALAVGDAAFQTKCLEKMSDAACSGRTVLFVSHNPISVLQLCRRAILLQEGRLSALGSVEEILRKYAASTTEASGGPPEQAPREAAADGSVRMHRIAVLPSTGIGLRTPIRIELEFWNREAGQILNPSVVVATEDGTPVFNTYPPRDHPWIGKPMPTGLVRAHFEIPPSLMNDGVYVVTVMVVRDGRQVILELKEAVRFEVIDDERRWGMGWLGKQIGVTRPRLHWELEVEESEEPDLSKPA